MTIDPLKAFGVSPDEDVWIFAYGSLMWNPEFDFVSSHKACVKGYHRRFCLHSRVHRGTTDRPGLVLGLDRGGSCNGMVFQVTGEKAKDVLISVWEREMPVGEEDIYIARRVPVQFADQKLKACTFVVNRKHQSFYDEGCKDVAAELIHQAVGMRGPNMEYLENTVQHLRKMGIKDPGLEDLRRRVQKLQGENK